MAKNNFKYNIVYEGNFISEKDSSDVYRTIELGTVELPYQLQLGMDLEWNGAHIGTIKKIEADIHKKNITAICGREINPISGKEVSPHATYELLKAIAEKI